MRTAILAWSGGADSVNIIWDWIDSVLFSVFVRLSLPAVCTYSLGLTFQESQLTILSSSLGYLLLSVSWLLIFLFLAQKDFKTLLCFLGDFCLLPKENWCLLLVLLMLTSRILTFQPIVSLSVLDSNIFLPETVNLLATMPLSCHSVSFYMYWFSKWTEGKAVCTKFY